MLPNSADCGARGHHRAAVLSVAALLTMGLAMPVHGAGGNAEADSPKTVTPIKRVIVVIGENRSLDHIYGTYIPKRGHSILNLLSERIVRADGSPGRRFAAARQFMTSQQPSYFISVLKKDKTAYMTLPAPTLGGAPNMQSTAFPSLPPFGDPFKPFLGLIEPSLEPNDLFDDNSEVQFATDSPLEEAGFEPSVSRDTTEISDRLILRISLRKK
jgi:hypothetical protein